MKPHFTTSPSPATSSSRGSEASSDRSHSTPAGSWKAPTRFLPAPVLMPVLPPTAASTIASRVVGHVHDADAAQPGRRDEAAQVGGRSPADRHDRVGPGEAGLAERLPAVGGHRRGLRALALGQAEGQDVVVLDEGVDDRVGQRAQRSGVQHGHPLDRLAEDAGQPSGEVVSDDDVVRRRAADVQDGVVAHPEELPDLGGDLVGRAVVGLDDVGRHRLVDGGALVEQRLDPRADVAEQQGAADAEPDALHRVGQPDAQEHDRHVGQQVAASPGRSTAPPPRARTPSCSASAAATAAASSSRKCVLARLHEDVGDLAARARLDVGVGVAHRDAPGLAEEPGHGRLAGAHRPDEHHARRHQRYRRVSR